MAPPSFCSRMADRIMSKPEKRPRRNFHQVFVDFYYTSTVHGICHAVNARSRTRRIFWILVFIICFIVMIIQLSFIIRKYLLYQIIVEVDIRYEHANFPAVTLCNLNPFKNSLTQQTEGVSQTLNMLTKKLAEKSKSDKTKIRLKREAEPEYVQRHDDPFDGDPFKNVPDRFRPVEARCVCDSRHHTRSCIPWTGENEPAYPSHYRRSMCMCDYDVDYKSPWPCYPRKEWDHRQCVHCYDYSYAYGYGHCPKRFWEGNEHIGVIHNCFCHKHFGHCLKTVASLIVPNIADLQHLDDSDWSIDQPNNETGVEPTVPLTTLEPDVIDAMGYEDSLDELATKAQGQENLVFAVASMSAEGKKSLSYLRDELILKCSFNGLDCDINRDFNLHVDPVYGNCYTFNHNETRVPPLRTSRAGATYGLRVLMYSNTSDYLPTTESIGVRVNVHSPSVTPFPDAFGYSAPVGTLSSFGIRQREIRRLPEPYGNCLEETRLHNESFIFKDYEYSVEGCFRSCFQHELIKQCSCGDPRYPVPNGTTTCETTNSTKRQCLKNNTLEADTMHGTSFVCDCKQPCREHAFEVTVSSSSWPSSATQVMECMIGDEVCLDHYRQNAAMVQVYFEQLNFESMEEVPVYLFANLLSDLGGQLGLWLGLSVVSGLEFIMLLLDISQTWYFDKKEEKQKFEENSFNPNLSAECMCSCTPTEPHDKHCERLHTIDEDSPSLVIPSRKRLPSFAERMHNHTPRPSIHSQMELSLHPRSESVQSRRTDEMNPSPSVFHAPYALSEDQELYLVHGQIVAKPSRQSPENEDSNGRQYSDQDHRASNGSLQRTFAEE